MSKRVYLGDGLYAAHDGFQFVLSAPRGFTEHYVALDVQVLEAFIQFIEQRLEVKITVTKVPRPKEETNTDES